ncbi:MAG: YkgJ family cysteine cluster protein [Ferruginibacter sp.]|nr:YkgJ family cysteine cluster protein [Ferruginibacter sp.]
MSKIKAVNFRSFKRKVSIYRSTFRKFINLLVKDTPRGIDRLTPKIEVEVWKEVDCLTCANCCKTMTPTYNTKDIKRIARHIKMTPEVFSKKYLRKDRDGDFVNKTQPCPFLNLKDNKCSIYTVRPDDCRGFPHLSKKKFVEYAHVHKQNIDLCPATFKMIEKMYEHYQ